MLMTKRKPATIGEILTEEFLTPMGLTQGALAEAMGVPRKHVNELCNDRRNTNGRFQRLVGIVFRPQAPGAASGGLARRTGGGAHSGARPPSAGAGQPMRPLVKITAATALILARVFGNSPEFWLNVQRRDDLWTAMHSPRERERIKRAKPLTQAA